MSDTNFTTDQLSAAVASAVTKALGEHFPKRTFLSRLADSSPVLLAVATLAVSALAFNSRLDRLDTKLESLATHVDSDFRTLVEKIDALAVKVAQDEGPPHK